MIWSLTRVCPAGAHVHSHCSNDSCAQWQRSHICYYTFVNNIHFKNAWFIYTLPKVGPPATSNMAHHWYYEPGWMWLETAAAKQAYQAIQDSLMQTVKLWWAFNWCVQQRELKRCEVWGLSRQSFHLNQPCLQCFSVRDILRLSYDMCRNERKPCSHLSLQMFDPYLMSRPNEAEPSDKVQLTKCRLSKKNKTTKGFRLDAEGGRLREDARVSDGHLLL